MKADIHIADRRSPDLQWRDSQGRIWQTTICGVVVRMGETEHVSINLNRPATCMGCVLLRLHEQATDPQAEG